VISYQKWCIKKRVFCIGVHVPLIFQLWFPTFYEYKSSGKNVWILFSFTSLSLNHKASRNYKLIIIQYRHSLTYIIVTFWKVCHKPNFVQVRIEYSCTQLYRCIYKWVQFNSKLQHTGIWSTAAWPPSSLCCTDQQYSLATQVSLSYHSCKERIRHTFQKRLLYMFFTFFKNCVSLKWLKSGSVCISNPLICIEICGILKFYKAWKGSFLQPISPIFKGQAVLEGHRSHLHGGRSLKSRIFALPQISAIIY
jgi:hypothetical protein